MGAAAVLLHFFPGKPASPVSIDPYRKAESILRARGFAADASGPSLGLAAQVVSYSSDECPQGAKLAVLSYDQLRIILERIPPHPATRYLIVAPSWERHRLDRLGLFLAGMSCKVREPLGSAGNGCEDYLYINYLPGCLREEDWKGFWRAP
jgi:hypothetical protein